MYVCVCVCVRALLCISLWGGGGVRGDARAGFYIDIGYNLEDVFSTCFHSQILHPTYAPVPALVSKVVQ